MINNNKGQAEEPTKLLPLIKWPGGKRALLKHITPYIPNTYGRYYEPFFGGGALFFALNPDKASLSDKNFELINLYSQVKEQPRSLIKKLKTFKNSEDDYYRIRELRPADPVESAARLMYLCNLSFNGIHRVNLKGDFNVPYGRKTHIDPCPEERILQISSALKNVTLRCDDFATSVSRAKAGDFVYFDPPYTVAHGTNGFIKYNDKIFLWADQIRLSELAKKLMDSGVHVIVSNADHPSVNDLYTDFKAVKIDRFSIIAASSNKRRVISEKIFISK
ncbi:DNA adenine methylase [Janthinobacterium sp. Marseille]|nr:Dam family site-specific DNA-(adenine-N6)-methyltransferase [Janthinobacterium sp. Marseille]ABR91509.1 DNA adenine methylase [Janthinobacterium sp. Marseille]